MGSLHPGLQATHRLLDALASFLSPSATRLVATDRLNPSLRTLLLDLHVQSHVQQAAPSDGAAGCESGEHLYV
jgi:hypothetical protein